MSTNCFKNPRCVKCAQNYITAECKKSSNTPAKCCNCSGEHPTSYSQCPAYLKFLEKRTNTLGPTEILAIASDKNLCAKVGGNLWRIATPLVIVRAVSYLNSLFKHTTNVTNNRSDNAYTKTFADTLKK